MDITRLCLAGCLLIMVIGLAGCTGTPTDQPANSSSSASQMVQIFDVPQTLKFSAVAGKASEPQTFTVHHSAGELMLQDYDSALSVTLTPLSSTQTQVSVAASPMPEQRRTGVLALQLVGAGNSYADASITVEFVIYQALGVKAPIRLQTYSNLPAQEFWGAFSQKNIIGLLGPGAEWRISCDDNRLVFSQNEGTGGGAVYVEFSRDAIFPEGETHVPCRIEVANSGEVIELSLLVLAHGGAAALNNPITFTLNPHGVSQELIARSQVIAVPGADYPDLHTDWQVVDVPGFVTVTPAEGNTATPTNITVELDVNHPDFVNYQFYRYALTLGFGRDLGDTQDYPIEIVVNTSLIKSTSSLVSFKGLPLQLLFDTHLLEGKSPPQQLEVLVGEQTVVATNIEGKYVVELERLPLGQHELAISGSEHLQSRTVTIKPPLTIAEQVTPVGSQDKLYFDLVQKLLVLFNEQEQRLTTFVVDGQGLAAVECVIDGEIKDVAQARGGIFAMTGKQVYRLNRSGGACVAQAMVQERYAAKSAYKIPDYQYFYPNRGSLIFARFHKVGMKELEPDEAIENYIITEALHLKGVVQGELSLGLVLFEEEQANDFISPSVISGNGLYFTNGKSEVLFGKNKYLFSQPMLDTRGGQFDFRGQWFLSADHQLFKLEGEVYRQVASFEGVKLSRMAEAGELVYTLTVDNGSFSVAVFGYRQGEMVRLQAKTIDNQMVEKDSTALMALAGDQRTLWIVIAGQLYTLELGL